MGWAFMLEYFRVARISQAVCFMLAKFQTDQLYSKQTKSASKIDHSTEALRRDYWTEVYQIIHSVEVH